MFLQLAVIPAGALGPLLLVYFMPELPAQMLSSVLRSGLHPQAPKPLRRVFLACFKATLVPLFLARIPEKGTRVPRSWT